MKPRDLTPDERWLYAPLYVRVLLRLFVIALPFIASIEIINL